jgi:hypothetical protein
VALVDPAYCLFHMLDHCRVNESMAHDLFVVVASSVLKWIVFVMIRILATKMFVAVDSSQSNLVVATEALNVHDIAGIALVVVAVPAAFVGRIYREVCRRMVAVELVFVHENINLAGDQCR